MMRVMVTEGKSRDERMGRTLEQLENDSWGTPPEDATYLVRTAFTLRTVPLGQLDTEALRLLIGQSISLDILVPIALNVLREAPLAEGDLYPGALLASVLRIPDSWFETHLEAVEALDAIVASVGEVSPAHGGEAAAGTELPDHMARWRARNAP